MTPFLSRTRIDRLGDRLREGAYGDADIQLLDEYRRSFHNVYESVVHTLRAMGFEPTGRPAKSTISIVEKLRRESIRLSQMQDIAGCRIVVATIVDQDSSVSTLESAFPTATVVDRRANPSHEYRAVHIISELAGQPIEIQVRSSLQHLWAELSEKLSDVRDFAIKYGAGPKAWRLFLAQTSRWLARSEEIERKLANLISLVPSDEESIRGLQPEVHMLQQELARLFTMSIALLDEDYDWPRIEKALLSQLSPDDGSG